MYVHAEIYIVRPDGTGDFPTIQAAIDAAADGDIVELTDGVFSGTGNWNIDFRGTALTLRSQSEIVGACVIDGADSLRGLNFWRGEGPETRVEGITLMNCRADRGGAMRCEYGSSPTITRCAFRENTALSYGGAVYCFDGSLPSFTECTFAQNHSDVDGGAFYAKDSSDCVLSLCSFESNHASHAGGALFGHGSALEIESCSFMADSADWRGGAVFLQEGTEVSITNSDLTGNASGNCGGGLFAVAPCEVNLSARTFEGNATYYDGGGVYSQGSVALHIEDCTFTDHVAGEGGAIFLEYSNQRHISNCRFERNAAYSGGAIYCYSNGCNPRVRECVFIANTASGSGGAIYSYESAGLFEFCTFARNEADDGGAVYVYHHGYPRFMGCTFDSNSAARGGGMYYSSGYYVTMERCIISFSTSGEAIYSGEATTLSCCNIYGNAGGDWIGAIAPLSGQDGNIGEDPLYCREAFPEAPLSLQEWSPCAAFSAPNFECELMGSQPVGCDLSDITEQQAGDEPQRIWSIDSAISVGSTHMSYQVPAPAHVKVTVYDRRGRRVRGLIDAYQAPGLQRLTWDGRDAAGHPLDSGVYFFRVELGSQTETARVLLVR